MKIYYAICIVLFLSGWGTYFWLNRKPKPFPNNGSFILPYMKEVTITDCYFESNTEETKK